MALTFEQSETASSDANKRKMVLYIKDFGPITNSKLELKPLTVFVGPNNSGKSYAARMVHAVFHSLSGNDFLDKFDFGMRKRLYGIL